MSCRSEGCPQLVPLHYDGDCQTCGASQKAARFGLRMRALEDVVNKARTKRARQPGRTLHTGTLRSLLSSTQMRDIGLGAAAASACALALSDKDTCMHAHLSLTVIRRGMQSETHHVEWGNAGAAMLPGRQPDGRISDQPPESQDADKARLKQRAVDKLREQALFALPAAAASAAPLPVSLVYGERVMKAVPSLAAVAETGAGARAVRGPLSAGAFM